jgi:hypothetical protein
MEASKHVPELLLFFFVDQRDKEEKLNHLKLSKFRKKKKMHET